MELDELNKFLDNSCDLSTLEQVYYSNGDGVLRFLKDDTFIDYDYLSSKVIAEVRKNIGNLNKNVWPIYFKQVETTFTKMESIDAPVYFPHGYLEKVELFYTSMNKEFNPNYNSSHVTPANAQHSFFLQCREKRSELIKKLKLQIDEIKNEILEEDFEQVSYESASQQIAWLHELGVIKTILDKCKNGNTVNMRKTAQVIATFTNINPETIRKSIEAIYTPSGSNQSNNPLNNSKNTQFVKGLLSRLKIDNRK